MSNPCMCGRPLPQGAVLCHRCGDQIADRLRKIADRWAELEDALQWREIIPGTIGTVQDDGPSDTAHGERKLPLSTGTQINQQAVNARRKATDLVWFMDQIMREDYQRAKKPPPERPVKGDRTQDQTPIMARWLAAWHVTHFTHRTSQESAEEVAGDVEKAERAVYRATHPKGERWVAVNLTCDQWGTTDQGERVPCPGEMWAYVGRDVMPDLICNADDTHRLEPGAWERAGWKKKHAQGLHPSGVARLLGKLG